MSSLFFFWHILLKSDIDADKVLEDKHFSECDRHFDTNKNTTKLLLQYRDIKLKDIKNGLLFRPNDISVFLAITQSSIIFFR